MRSASPRRDPARPKRPLQALDRAANPRSLVLTTGFSVK